MRTTNSMLLSAFLLITVTLVVLDSYLTRYTAQRHLEDVRQRLAIEAQILAGELESVAPSEREA